MSETTTIEIDKETHTLIRQYCLLNGLRIKDFVREVTYENLEGFRTKLDYLKKVQRYR